MSEQNAQFETKRTIRAKKLLLFFAEWADETKSFGIETLEQSLDYLEEAFIQSSIADNREAREETFYWLHGIRRLVRELKKKCPNDLENIVQEILALEPKPAQS